MTETQTPVHFKTTSIADTPFVYCGNEPGIHWDAVAETIAEWTNQQDSPLMLEKTAADISEQLALGRCIVLFMGRFPVGYATCYALLSEETPRNMQWWEFGSVVVDPLVRGYKLSSRLYQELPTLQRELGGKFVQTTKATKPFHGGERHGGMQEGSFVGLPDNVHVGVCSEAPCFVAGACGKYCAKRAILGGKNTCRLQIRF